MGNRANIVFVSKRDSKKSPCIYLHWNGGAESVYTFVDALCSINKRQDIDYFPARFIQFVGNYFGGSLSLGVSNVEILDNSSKSMLSEHQDNGLYIFNVDNMTVERWIKGRKLSEEEIEREKKYAKIHKYNEDGKLFKESISANKMFIEEVSQ